MAGRWIRIATQMGFSAFIACSGVANAAAGALPASSNPTTSAPPSISHLNEPNGHYAETNGVVDAKLYEAPVGISSDPATDTWHVRRPTLTASLTSTTTLNVTDLPFSESLDNTNPEADLI